MNYTSHCLHHLFEEQVQRSPQATAIIFENTEFSYEALDRRANQFANRLRSEGVGPGTLVGLHLERSVEMVVAVLGVLKAGACNVLLDTNLPEKRLKHLINQSAVPLIVSGRLQSNQLQGEPIIIDGKALLQFIEKEDDGPVATKSTSEDAAYIAFTSGSTGEPKGVIIPHRAVARCLVWAEEVFHFNKNDRFVLNFFRAPEELFFPLLTGSTVILSPPGAERDPSLLIETIEKHKITVLGMTPSLLNALLNHPQVSECKSLRHVYCAGEILTSDIQQRFFSHLSAKLYNAYGLAEAPYTSIWQCRPDDDRKIVPVGYPLDVSLKVLNEALEPVEPSEVGEIFIGGAGLTLGYLNQPTITASRFETIDGNNYYRTGDQAIQGPDLELILLGRTDLQVQIGGIRTELGEIESALRNFSIVQEAAVTWAENRLVAYLQVESENKVNKDDLKAFLQTSLPSYLIPSAFFIIDKMPLTMTGKINRNDLSTMKGHGIHDLRVSGYATNKSPVVSPELYQRLTESWPKNVREYPREKSVNDVFANVVLRHPNRIAVAFENNHFTYQEIADRSEKLAAVLHTNGIGPGKRVGVCLERSPEIIICMLAVLRSGAAYVPLSPSDPPARLRQLVENAETSVVLSHKPCFNRLRKAGLEPQLIEELEQKDIASADITFPQVSPLDPAYLMYTSGTTGSPKGSLISHRGIVRLVKNTDYVDLSSEHTFLQLASPTFDAATFEIWGPLLNGGKLALIPSQVPSLRDIGDAIIEHGVTTLWLTAGLFHTVVDEAVDILKPLDQLLTGGDTVSPTHIVRCRRTHPHLTIINGYGPTENTTFSCCYTIPIDPSDKQPVPIGRPIANSEAYILDSNLEPVSPGTTGELYLGGDGLSLGYWKLPELNQQVFIPHPFASESGVKLYKSGDLARYQKDGIIEFLGRKDAQVKIRGFRIELEEIESVLKLCPSIQQCCAFVVDKKVRSVSVAFKRQTDTNEFRLEKVKAYLRERLPQYMQPENWLEVNVLPLTRNGKVDRLELSKMLSANHPNEQVESVPPETETEKNLLQIWSRLFHFDSINCAQDFFDLGGNSLLAMHLSSEIERHFNQRIAPAAIFQHPTIRALGHLLEGRSPEEKTTLVTLRKGGSRLPLYVFHGWGGEVFAQVNFVQNFPEDIPVYGIQAVEHSGESERLQSFEEMADRYAQDILAQQPEGPFFLSGFSLGGMIAFETARQLSLRGHEIGRLFVFDTQTYNLPRHVHWRAQIPYLFSRIRYHLSRVRRMPYAEVLDYLAGRKKAAFHRLGLTQKEQNIHEVPHDSDYYSILNDQYTPKPCPIPVSVFVAAQNRVAMKKIWNYLSCGHATCIRVQSSHLEMFDDSELAKEIGKLL